MSDRVARAVKAGEHNVAVEGAGAKPAPRFIGENKRLTASYDLQFPMEWDGAEYRVVEFRRPKGSDFRKIKVLVAMGTSEDEVMVAVITSLPIEVIRELDGDDYVEVLELAKGFIPARFLGEESGQPSESGQNTQES